MTIVWMIAGLGDFVVHVGGEIVRAANRVRGIYLVGLYLYPIMADTGFNVITMGSQIVGVSRAFEAVYWELRNGAVLSGALQTLVHYANQLIDFIANPLAYIRNWVKQVFYWIEYIYYNAYDFISPHVVRLLDTYFPQWRDLRSFVIARIGELFQDFNTLRFNPVQWVIDRLRAYSYNVGRFLSDPDGYLIEKVKAYFPDLHRFLSDPAGYIIEKLSDKLEIFAERNLMRLVKIVENILDAIF